MEMPAEPKLAACAAFLYWAEGSRPTSSTNMQTERAYQWRVPSGVPPIPSMMSTGEPAVAVSMAPVLTHVQSSPGSHRLRYYAFKYSG